MATSVSSSVSLLEKYQKFLDEAAGVSESSKTNCKCIPLPPALSVGIIGGGMAGLYSAQLLQRYIPGAKVKIFEASNRVGGCVYTYRFSPEPNQYFEAGAMRIPVIEGHQPVFTLIDYLNMQFPQNPMELIDFKYLSLEGNRVFVNHKKQKDGRIMSAEYAAKWCSELGFPKDLVADGDNASKLYLDALIPIANAMEENFEAALKRYGNISLHDYLSKELSWSSEKMKYVEVMCCQTNDFRRGLLEIFFFDGIFNFQLTWKTIQGGMSKLPELCAEDIRQKHGKIIYNATVESLAHLEDGTIRIGYPKPDSKELEYETFDAVILAIPPPFIRMIPKRPHFGTDLELALRSSGFAPMSKLGLRFKTRFWERPDLNPPPSYGGQSTTDLPSRWIIYPDYGVGDSDKGVLHTYNWESDSQQWRLLSTEEKIKLALRDLQLLYPEVNIADEYAGGEPTEKNFLNEAFSMDWWGMTFYNPGEFLSFYPSMATPQGNLYFAGAHLGSSLGWILSALESSKRAVQQLAMKYGVVDVEYIK